LEKSFNGQISDKFWLTFTENASSQLLTCQGSYNYDPKWWCQPH